MESRFVTYLRLLVLFGIGLLFAADTRSQSLPPDVPSVPHPAAIKVEELGHDLCGETYSAGLDAFGAMLQENPAIKALIIGYGPEGDQSGTGTYLMNRAKDYLVRRSFDPNRIITVYGGPAKVISEVGMEFWLIPTGAKLPKPVANRINFDTFIGMTGKYWGSEGSDLDGEGCGPSPGRVALAAFAQVLRRQPNSIGYLVAYQTDEDGLGAWRRIGQYNIQLLKEYGIDTQRLKIIHGEGDDRSLHFWVQPKDEPLPIKEAAPDHLPDKAVQVRDYDEYQLSDSKDQEFAFRAIADLLKEYPDAKVCYMIMPSYPDDDEMDNEEEHPKEKSTEHELPTADFRQIVNDWKLRFITELKIDPNRIVILFPSDVEDGYKGKMLTWIVPANAALPMPPKNEDEPSNDDPSPIRC